MTSGMQQTNYLLNGGTGYKLFLVWILGSTIFCRFSSACDSVHCIVEQYL